MTKLRQTISNVLLAWDYNVIARVICSLRIAQKLETLMRRPQGRRKHKRRQTFPPRFGPGSVALELALVRIALAEEYLEESAKVIQMPDGRKRQF